MDNVFTTNPNVGLEKYQYMWRTQSGIYYGPDRTGFDINEYRSINDPLHPSNKSSKNN